jgi:uncharacterized protein YdeI (YjbR/CyaY-like superfamily)
VEITETVHAKDRDEWRAWLETNYDTKSEIWLITYHKASDKVSVPYNDAVEEALCFGWIDGIQKSYDDESSAQRYTPRRPGSGYSQLNKERLARLIEQGKVIPSVLEQVKDIRAEDYVIPDDVVAALRAEQGAWEFFSATSPAYQRIRSAYVEEGRGRGDEFERRLNNLVKRSAQGKRIGYGIEDYY